MGAALTELRTVLRLAGLLAQLEGAAARGEIENCLARAGELIEATGARIFTAQLCVERAEWMRALGDEEARRRELERAHRLYAEMGADGHAERLAGILATHFHE